MLEPGGRRRCQPQPENEFDPESAMRDALLAQRKDPHHPERYILGKPHPGRAAQFKPFAALRGYEELVEQVMAEAAEPHDFSDLEDPC